MMGSSRLKDLIMADAVVSEAVTVSTINGTILPSLLNIGRKSSLLLRSGVGIIMV